MHSTDRTYSLHNNWSVVDLRATYYISVYLSVGDLCVCVCVCVYRTDLFIQSLAGDIVIRIYIVT